MRCVLAVLVCCWSVVVFLVSRDSSEWKARLREAAWASNTLSFTKRPILSAPLSPRCQLSASPHAASRRARIARAETRVRALLSPALVSRRSRTRTHRYGLYQSDHHKRRHTIASSLPIIQHRIITSRSRSLHTSVLASPTCTFTKVSL